MERDCGVLTRRGRRRRAEEIGEKHDKAIAEIEETRRKRVGRSSYDLMEQEFDLPTRVCQLEDEVVKEKRRGDRWRMETERLDGLYHTVCTRYDRLQRICRVYEERNAQLRRSMVANSIQVPPVSINQDSTAPISGSTSRKYVDVKGSEDELDPCTICMDNMPNILLFKREGGGCMHLGMCSDCLPDFLKRPGPKKCPKCRTSFNKYTRINY